MLCEYISRCLAPNIGLFCHIGRSLLTLAHTSALTTEHRSSDPTTLYLPAASPRQQRAALYQCMVCVYVCMCYEYMSVCVCEYVYVCVYGCVTCCPVPVYGMCVCVYEYMSVCVCVWVCNVLPYTSVWYVCMCL